MFAMQTTAPVDKATVKTAPAQILVTFTQEVDASLVNGTTVSLARIDPESAAVNGGVVMPANGATVMPASARLAPMNPAVLLITPSTRLQPGVYRVTLRGAGGGALANMNAVTLGADTSFEFTVEPAQ
jgi:methionine-rich copper-binding protein CopC